jgi:hypothetical protein
LRYQKTTSTNSFTITTGQFNFIQSNGTTEATNLANIAFFRLHISTTEGTDVSGYINTWDDTVAPVRGYLTVKSNINGSAVITVLEITGASSQSGNAITLTAKGVAGSAPTAYSNLSNVVLEFNRVGGGGASDVKLYVNTSTSWQKPIGAKRVFVTVIGAGGGGGGGAKGQNNDDQDILGGAGGGGGAIISAEFSADTLPSSVNVVAGNRGSQGNGAGTGYGPGGAGGNGSDSRFGHIVARGGRGGGGAPAKAANPTVPAIGNGGGRSTTLNPGTWGGTPVIIPGGNGAAFASVNASLPENRIYGTTGGGFGGAILNAQDGPFNEIGSDGGAIPVITTNNANNNNAYLHQDILTAGMGSANNGFRSVVNTNTKNAGGLNYTGSYTGVLIGIGGAGGACQGLNVNSGEGGDGGDYGGGGGGGAALSSNTNTQYLAGKGGYGGYGCVLVIST